MERTLHWKSARLSTLILGLFALGAGLGALSLWWNCWTPVTLSFVLLAASLGFIPPWRTFSEDKRIHALDQIATQQMEIVSTLAAGVAHDVNNLLTVIQGHTELVLDGDLLPRTKANLTAVAKATNKAAELSKRLILLSRRGSSEPALLDPQELLNDFREQWAGFILRGIDVHYHTENDLRVSVDSLEFNQVLFNLLFNARNVVDERTGRIDVELYQVERTPDDCLPLAIHAPCAVISVSDNGAGIDPVLLPTLFESSQDVDLPHGIGLWAVYAIVRGYSGAVRAKNLTTGGARFEVYIPLC